MRQTHKKQLDNLSFYEEKIRTIEDAFENRTVKTNKPYHIRIPGHGELVVRGGSRQNATGIVFATARKESWQFVPE